MVSHETLSPVASAFLAGTGNGRSTRTLRRGEIVFSQGDPAESVYFIERGGVKLSTLSSRGKEAVIGILGEGDFFGEGCLAGQSLRLGTASTVGHSSIVAMKKHAMLEMLRDDPSLADLFMTHLLRRNVKFEEDLVDQLFNSSEKRLARMLLLLANFGSAGETTPVIAKLSQQTLAEMVGTTRSRVSFFMNKFRKLGFVEYRAGLDGLHVHPSLLNVVLND